MRNDQVSGNFGGSPPKVSAPLLLTNDGIIGRRRFIIPLTPGANSDLVPVEVCISVDFSNSVFFFLFPPSLPVLAMAFITRLSFMRFASVPARFAFCGAVGVDGRGRRRRGRLTFGSPIRCRRSADDQPSCHTRKLFCPTPKTSIAPLPHCVCVVRFLI